MVTALGAAGRRLVRGRAAARTLARLGIDPPRFWLLFDLFATLGARQEVAMLGADYSLRSAALVLFVLSSVASLVGVATGASPAGYLLFFVGLTTFLLAAHLVAEIAENLVNPVVELTLAHQPVTAGTWSAAKLSHLVKVVVYLVGGMNGVPAVAGVLLPHAAWGSRLAYPAVHLLAALGAGLVVALLCCSLFGWLVRFVPVRRLKAVAAAAQALPLFALWAFQFAGGPEAGRALQAWAASLALPAGLQAAADAMPGGLRGALAAAGAVVAIGAVGFGLRALSSDKLLRVAGLMRSGVRSPRRRRRRLPGAGPWVGRLAGGPAARAGFEHVRILIVRDWQFLRNVGMNAAGVIAAFALVLVAGRDPSPFRPGGTFPIAHVLPHVLGWAAVFACRFLAYGNDHKGAWAVAAAPDSSLRPFASGVHAALWLLLIAAPHAGWLLIVAWSWGAAEAAGFVAFSAALASLYLAGSLRLIDGLPFGRPPRARISLAAGAFLAVMLPGFVVVGIQLLLFRSAVAVAVATLVVAAAAWLLARVTLPGLAARIRSSLHHEPSGSMFRFAYADDD